MKKLLFIIPIILLTSWSCQKEPATKPSVKIRTNLVDNTIALKKTFMLYIDQMDGEFLVYFKGETPKKTWRKDVLTSSGRPIEAKDSLEISGYTATGEYTFTVVATSYGNWAGEQLQAVDSIRITVN
jgi:hypothetical protein